MSEEKEQNSQAEMLYDYCIDHDLGRGMTRKWGAKHFQLLIDNLMPKEKLATVFIGMHNYKGTGKHDSFYAYGITDKRIICAQKHVVGETVQSIKWANINDITLSKGFLYGVVEIDTYKETVNVGVDKDSAQNIYDSIMDVHDKLERQKMRASNASHEAQPPKEDDAFDKIKKLKELLDMEAITQEEYDLKKKELLGL